MASAGPVDLPVELWAACLRHLKSDVMLDGPASAQHALLELLIDLICVAATSRRLKAAALAAAPQCLPELRLPAASSCLASGLLLELCHGVTKLVLYLGDAAPLGPEENGALLSKLQGSLPSLAHLDLWLPPGPVSFPAQLAHHLPASLQRVHLRFKLQDLDIWDFSPKVALDFCAFKHVELSIWVASEGLTLAFHANMIRSSLLPALSAVGYLHSLCIALDELAVGESYEWLPQLQVAELTLQVAHNTMLDTCDWSGEPAHFEAFPACQRLEVCYLTASAPSLTMSWEALAAKPGVYVLGCEAQPLTTLLEIVDFGCPTEFPAFSGAWALVVYGDLRWVDLDQLTFVEERPGMHVCRNEAAASLQL